MKLRKRRVSGFQACCTKAAKPAVSFSGNGYASVVHINVLRNSDSSVYDDFDYDATAGSLNFTETLVPGGTYTVTITQSGSALSTTVTTGDD